MAKRAHAVTIPALAFHGGIPDDRPRTRRPEGPARQRPASPPGRRVAGGGAPPPPPRPAPPPPPPPRGAGAGPAPPPPRGGGGRPPRPGPHTVGEIARDLGRSAGAVGN